MELHQKTIHETRSSSQQLKKVYQFFDDVKQEFLKIQWTDNQEVRVLAKIVVGATFFFGFVLYVADVFVQKILFGFDACLKLLFG